MKGHCCFAGCDLVACRRCGEQRCVRALHVCARDKTTTQSSTFRPDGLGPLCARCGQRISGTSRKAATVTVGDLLADAHPADGPWVNEPCGCRVEQEQR